MLGGGTFTSQNKVLGGTYHNFISARRDYLSLADRGYVAFPFVYGWGKDGDVLTVTAEDFEKNALGIFGKPYDSDELRPVRDIFRNSHTIQFYFIKGATAAAASNTFFTAKYKGTVGNGLKTVITSNVDDSNKFDVVTYLNDVIVDSQLAVATAADLKENEYANPIPSATLAVNAGVSFAGGLDGTPSAAEYQAALDTLESFNFNVLICDVTTPTIKSLFSNYTIRLRDEVGMKFQLVTHGQVGVNSEGVINVFNGTVGAKLEGLVYWIAGASAGVGINASNQNKLYDGEYEVDLTGAKTSTQLIDLQESGKYVLHRVDGEVRVLADINSFTDYTVDKNESFSMNQVIRVLDQIAVDTANIFNTRYLGKVPNDQAGRVSLWADIVAHRRELERQRAIKTYAQDLLTIEQGQQKEGVVANEYIDVTVAMSKLYVTTVVA